MALDNGLFFAEVAHRRLRPKKNFLKYQVYYLAIPLSQLEKAKNPLLSLNRFNLFSLYDRDHGERDDTTMESWIRGILKEEAIDKADGEIVLVTLPRLLGHVFNPVSFWFCLDKKQSLRAVLAEVNNTFQETHSYLLTKPDLAPITQDDWLESDKMFHVSPFLEVKGRYRFRFFYSERKIGAWIDHFIPGEGDILLTSMVGNRSTLSAGTLLKAFFSIPIITLKVIGLIHYQALKLKLKGVTYRRKPAPPTKKRTRWP